MVMNSSMTKGGIVDEGKRVRRTQRERSAAMRERLLDAAIDCLFELGYAGTTTIEVAARAGVSRGAQLHHFPTKEQLVALSVRHLLARRLREYREAMAALPAVEDGRSAALDVLWEMTSSRAWYAWMELVVAARADPELRKTMSELEGQFLDEVEAVGRERHWQTETGDVACAVAPALALAVLQGVALDRILWAPDDPRHESVLTSLKSMVQASVAESTRLKRGA
jgi:AcrR family transcriptional regulator